MEVLTTSFTEIDRVFALQTAHQYTIANTTAKERKKKLKLLLHTIMKYRTAIQEASYADFRKPAVEVDLSEVYAITSEIKHTLGHLDDWMEPESVSVPLPQLGTSATIQYEPKGVVLVISPWNFPFNLTFGPLVSAIASGNCVIVKPSEMTPNSAALISKIIEEVFPKEEVAVFEGNADVAIHLTQLPFNHIFFTGSPSLGKKVMAAAAENLCSVTLELGGKTPVIVDASANLEVAAKRITWAKFINNGQVCIAPDYIWVEEKVADRFLALVKENIKAYYTENPDKSPDYCRAVSDRQFARTKSLLEDAVSQGAKVIAGGKHDASQRFMEPTVLTQLHPDSIVMREEIFGPLMPVLTYTNLDQVVKYIQDRDKPLALYIYSHDSKNIKNIRNNTRSGAIVINNNALHFLNQSLPFGGSNNSGIGKSHGVHGFREFCNAKSVVNQWSPFSALDLLTPPYNTRFKQWLVDFTVKYL